MLLRIFNCKINLNFTQSFEELWRRRAKELALTRSVASDWWLQNAWLWANVLSCTPNLLPTVFKSTHNLLLLFLLLLTAVELSLYGSSPYTCTDKSNKNKYTERNSTNNTKHSKYKYTYYQNTHTYTHLHITKQVKTTTVQYAPKLNDAWLLCHCSLSNFCCSVSPVSRWGRVSV